MDIVERAQGKVSPDKDQNIGTFHFS
jgi:hypothetical protein